MDCVHASTGPPRGIFEKTSGDISGIGGDSNNSGSKGG